MKNLQCVPEASGSCYNFNILNVCYWALGSYCLVFTQENHCIVLYAQIPMTNDPRRKFLKTFVAPFISTRLTAPRSPKMYMASGLHLVVQPNPGEQTSHKPIENRPFSHPAWFD